MGRAHDPRSAAIGGSCEDRRLAGSQAAEADTRLRRPDLERHRGARRPSALWRAARRTRTNEMNLIQELEAEAIEHSDGQGTSPNSAPAIRCASASRWSKASAPASRISKASASPARTGAGQQLHRPQDQLRRRRRARLPALFAQRRFIDVVRRGVVRRAKLYYLRGRTGKSARIAERRDPRGGQAAAPPPEAETETAES